MGAYLTEIVTIIAACAIQVLYFTQKKVRINNIFLLTATTFPAIIMSIWSMNSFLTCDEEYIIYEIIHLPINSLANWKYGALRTTDLLVGVPVIFVKALTGFTSDIMALFAKSLHWIIGFCTLIFTIDILIRMLSKKERFIWAYALMFNFFMLMPVVLLAIKIIQYDLLSMSLGVLAIVVFIYGLQNKEKKWFILSVVFSALASQEKLIATPVLWVCLSLVPLKVALDSGKEKFSDVLKVTLLETLKVTGIALLVVLGTFAVVNLINNKISIFSNTFSLFYPLISVLFPVLRFLGINIPKILQNDMLFCDPLYIPLFSILFVILFLVINIALITVVYASKADANLQKKISHLSNYLPVLNYILFVILLISGICGTYFLDAWIAPFKQPIQGAFLPTLSFNETSVHFDMSNLFTHTLACILWSYTIFINAIPTSVVVLVLINAFCCFTKSKDHISPAFEIVFMMVLWVPFGYGMFQVPVINRYLNLFLFLFTVITVYKLISLNFDSVKVKTLTVLCCIFLLIEVFPFKPLFGAFRPVWANYSKLHSTTPLRGAFNPWWIGWGEEISIVGKRIEKNLIQSNPDLRGVNIYHNGWGAWLYQKNSALILKIDTCANLRYTKNDYYIFIRGSTIQSYFSFPQNVPVYDIVSYRGFVTAWVFRGDELKKHGFTLGKER